MPKPALLKQVFTLLTLATPIIMLTGFTGVQPIAETTPQITVHAAPAVLPPSPVPPPAGETIYQWRRPQLTENGRTARAEPETTPIPAAKRKDRVLNWDTGEGKSYLIPALEVAGFLIGLNIFDRIFLDDDRQGEGGRRTYYSTTPTIWHHLRDQNWEYDTDPFNVNQFAHPYQGATMYGLARSCGLGFWQSWAYSHVGSFAWKMAGETDPPSINDMITTGNSGSLLGEALFRMSQLVLKEQHGEPDAWHELAAAFVSPPTGFNRLVFGDRFKSPFPSHDPATFWRFRTGFTFDQQDDFTTDFQMSYGLPGKDGYSYRRPLDYFDFQISGLARASNPVGNVLLRGLLFGKEYEAGKNYRGIWGLYGSYDYISPTIFRVSTTAVSLGTTAQYWISRDLALQGTVLGGVGFGAAGEAPNAAGQRDYHYGVTPQGMLALRLVYGTRLAFESVLRGYYVSGTGADNLEGSEAVLRSNTNLIYRIYGRHGISLQFIEAVRDADYGRFRSIHQTDGTVGIFYTFLGDTHLGAVEWRNQQPD
ncbi:DUF3943 domain-containing protein [Geomonas sp.]|uniref:DUF3943 domain-containing protein n=1 Tax=Geomonas sp. TaxID=2651584 RepID=UPI002B494DBD|nr:DUF3943 domain-containing protein [Geomonas sp.]HJV35754.1 DUF3943 domain-containing protein [Geomonas sp.]